jgi:DNA (cytosine-5)-methyltransferase 1
MFASYGKESDGMNELALFAGAGGGILGGKLLGWRTVCAVEWEKYPASVLLARQNDGVLPSFPIWDDVQTFDGKPWRGIVDVISGGFPCQDISSAGKGAGIDGERSGMWSEMARIISEVRPKYTFIENSPMLTSRGLERVLADLASMGFDAEWGVLGANEVGANHKRDRIWIVGRNTKWQMADTDSIGHIHRKPEINATKNRIDALSNPTSSGKNVANSRCEFWQKGNSTKLDKDTAKWSYGSIFNKSSGEGYGTEQWWATEPNVGRVVDGMADRVDRLKAIGNGQVPLCAATAWELLSERLVNRN